jgi:hypothetical protein
MLATCGIIRAQEAYMNLIFSEVRMDQWHHSYAEITNMGSVSVDLAQFEIGSIGPWDDPFVPGANNFVMLPARMLNPGESFVVATVRDWAQEMSIVNPERYGPITKPDTWRIADMQLHLAESPNNDPTDSISTGNAALTCWSGSYCFYLRHHFSPTDSMVVDAVNGIFTSSSGRRPDGLGASDVAGVIGATGNSILIRKYSVKTGTGDALDTWDRTRGIDLTDSEWLPVPTLNVGGYEAGRKEFWTVGNHENARLNAQNLKSSTIDIDWNTKTMTVDWGARNMDSIMNEFDFAPGIAWHYFVSPNKVDSAYTSVRTGDSLMLYACGNQLDAMKFELIALPPTPGECRVIPKNANGGGNWYTPYIVTEDVPVMDSILNVPFDTRVDTLLKYLEKPEKATWEIIWVDGTLRPDLKKGDILKVTSENKSKAKEYFINVEKYLPSHNANLSSITWPDIPEYYKGILGWMGDTIPNFSPTKFNYKIQIPYDVPGIPAFVVKPENTDAKIEVTRAASLAGSIDDRTVRYYVTAEDDTTHNTYSIELDKEKDLTNVQPYTPKPFFSQFVFRADWRQFFIEICNPGNQPLDLSRYCIVRSYSETPADAIAVYSGETDWANRYNRYVPGYIWQDETNWTVQPSILEQDFSVNTIVEPGDVFVIGWAFPTYKDVSSRQYPGFTEIDVNFKNGYNPWGITFTEDALANYQNIAGGWYNNSWLLYEITNDSVLNGLKPLGDPEDVQIVDIIGRCDGTNPGSIDGVTFDQNSGLKRLPQYHKGNIEPGGSFGDGTVGSAEWLYTNAAYWQRKGYGWPAENSMNSDGIGSHEMNTITEFISTISSVSFVVSKGYSLNETIIGPTPGITVDEFLQKIIKADTAQVLTLTRQKSTVLSGADALVTGDELTVISADGLNTTKYVITVALDALDNNAVLTSSVYTIDLSTTPATISGFSPGTPLKTVYDGVKAPETASLFTIYNADGTYSSFKQINFDTIYVDVVATDRSFFEVVAQNGTTKITYQLQPTSSASDAYVLSNVYDIDQEAALIKLILDGSNVTAFFNSLIPAPGATMELQNNMGQKREMGTIYVDDKLVVTAMDGVTKKVYSLKMLSETAQERRAFAFSTKYTVSQNALSIKVPFSAEISVNEFIENIYVSTGASFVLQNANDTDKTSGNIVAGDKIKVTSADGSNTRIYVIGFLVSSPIFKQGVVKVYPNPTSGEIRFLGVKPGNNVTVYNSAGSKIMTFKVINEFENISLDQQPSGLYFIMVNDGRQVIGRSKLIKK